MIHMGYMIHVWWTIPGEPVPAWEWIPADDIVAECTQELTGEQRMRLVAGKSFAPQWKNTIAAGQPLEDLTKTFCLEANVSREKILVTWVQSRGKWNASTGFGLTWSPVTGGWMQHTAVDDEGGLLLSPGSETREITATTRIKRASYIAMSVLDS